MSEWDAFPVAQSRGTVTVRPFSKGGDEWDAFPRAERQSGAAPRMGVGEDMARSAGSGLVRGVGGLIGLPGAVADLGAKGIDAATQLIGNAIGVDAPRPKGEGILPNPEQVTGFIEENITGPLHQPQTTAGKYTRTAAEFVPAALSLPFGGGASVAANIGRNALRYGVAPGLASEGAGQATEQFGPTVENTARAVAAIGTGLGVAGLSRQPSATRAVREYSGQLDDATLNAAEALFIEAQQMGVPITRAEAVQHVTRGGTRLADLQRVVEGGGRMRENFAGRPQQTEAAAGPAFNQVTPATPAPSSIGPAAGRAAEDTINDVRDVINRASEPYYRAAAPVRLSPAEMQRVRALPGYEQARNAVRNDPQRNRRVANLPDDSVGFLNEVKKYFDEAAENAASPVQQGRSQQRASGFGEDATDVRTAAETASQDYAIALGIQRQSRERFLEPLLQGPLGKIADKDITTRKAIDALFPSNPLPNSADEVATAVAALAQRNPWAARQLVRAHAESVFNQATENLIGGANQFGGAKFAAILRGNPQQAANLEAAVRALPNGDGIWRGFDRFLNVLEATGQRQRIGSQTAFNQEMQRDLAQGGLVEGGAKLVSGVGVKLPQKILETVERWRLGRNLNEIARILTDPAAAREFRALAQMSRDGRGAVIMTGRIVAMVNASAEGTVRPIQGQGQQPRNN